MQGRKLSSLKQKQLIKLTNEGLSMSVIAKRLGMATAQIAFQQKKFGIYTRIYKKTKED